ncbi:camphor resistance protein CrcB [Vitreoscilla filiformis]|jgi:CrcB protein|uniref:Fluoride-specific ion channel FluC n=1 Tax=Vitreoscilla filiformis TaxID=63 RepID=A0A221KH74_VITFI|nr:CrcB family protein [Vitreoscilla filiformis]ASM78391.1 camphor resistance protein CrcB [Vitreoscilla filiformis]
MSAVAQPAWLLGLAVALGGGVGSVLRWRIGLWLNPLALPFSAGTLAVNCVGGLLIGLLVVWFEEHPSELGRLALITGGLGGLTTFSAFSAESLSLLLRGLPGLALVHSLAHLLGALACAALGWWLGRLIWT